jgi:hypothetical protein
LFPQNIAMAASRNPELVAKAAKITGMELRQAEYGGILHLCWIAAGSHYGRAFLKRMEKMFLWAPQWAWRA